MNKFNFNIFDGLKSINLEYCNLEVLENRTFTGLKSLEIINLRFNTSLKVIEPNCFIHCNNLKSINLEYCNLEILENRTFTGLKLLEIINLRFNNLIYFYSTSLLNNNIILNQNFLDKENHELLLPLKNYLGNIQQDLSHYEYFKIIINKNNFKNLIIYLVNIDKDLFNKNIFIIFYIIVFYLLRIDIFTDKQEIKDIINKFLDSYMDSYTIKFIKKLKISKIKDTDNLIKSYFSSKFNDYIINREFNILILKMLRSLQSIYINIDLKNIISNKINIIKDYIMTKDIS